MIKKRKKKGKNVNLDGKFMYDHALDHNIKNCEELCYFNHEYTQKNTRLYLELGGNTRIYLNV